LLLNERDVAGPGESIEFGNKGVALRIRAEVEHAGLLLQVVNLQDGSCTSDTRDVDGVTPTLELNVLYEKEMVAKTPIDTQLFIEESGRHRIAAWILPVSESYLAHDGVAVAAPIEMLGR
jgi:hypothetical protein